MHIGIIGSGFVAQTLGAKLLEAGNEVRISSRDTGGRKTTGRGELSSPKEWVASQRSRGLGAACGGFGQAATFGDLIVNATAGDQSLAALSTVDPSDLGGKILIDLANPLDFSGGAPPTLAIANTSSLAEKIQESYPEARVIKTLNTVNVEVMVAPDGLADETDMFVAGNDADAKRWVTDTLLKDWLGWRRVIDLGDITAARGMEMYLPLWLRLSGALGTGRLNIKIVRGA